MATISSHSWQASSPPESRIYREVQLWYKGHVSCLVVKTTTHGTGLLDFVLFQTMLGLSVWPCLAQNTHRLYYHHQACPKKVLSILRLTELQYKPHNMECHLSHHLPFLLNHLQLLLKKILHNIALLVQQLPHPQLSWSLLKFIQHQNMSLLHPSYLTASFPIHVQSEPPPLDPAPHSLIQWPPE